MISLNMKTGSTAPTQAVATGLMNANFEQAMPVVVVADDEVALTGEIADYIQRYGMRAIEVNSFGDLLALLQRQKVDAILLDHRFGTVDTLVMLPQLRSMTDVPILMHTGNREEMDRVLGLEQGADDFLLKPVSGRELVARLRAHLRRPSGRPLAHLPFTPQVQFSGTPAAAAAVTGSWRVVQAQRRVYRPDGLPLRLTTAEFDTLTALAQTPGEVRSRDDLTKLVFRRDWRQGDRAVDNAVLHLRQKLRDDLGEDCIATVRQLGYVFSGFPA